jgi:hypothetical protein
LLYDFVALLSFYFDVDGGSTRYFPSAATAKRLIAAPSCEPHPG